MGLWKRWWTSGPDIADGAVAIGVALYYRRLRNVEGKRRG